MNYATYIAFKGIFILFSGDAFREKSLPLLQRTILKYDEYERDNRKDQRGYGRSSG